VVDGCSLLSDLCEASFGFPPVTVVLAPPEACTTLDGGSSVDSVVDEPADVSEESDDGDVVWSAGSDVEAVESVCEAVPVSATATPALLAIATPSPNATASAPTRPMYFAQPAFSL